MIRGMTSTSVVARALEFLRCEAGLTQESSRLEDCATYLRQVRATSPDVYEQCVSFIRALMRGSSGPKVMKELEKLCDEQ